MPVRVSTCYLERKGSLKVPKIALVVYVSCTLQKEGSIILA